MTLELADRSVSKPLGIAKDVSFKVGVFHFPVDFVVVDFEPNPRVPLILGRFYILDMPEDIKVPLILGRPFLSTAHVKIDVFKWKNTLRVREEKIIFKSVKPARSLIKRVYMLSIKERMELDLEDRLMGETLLKRDQVDDLMPTIKECKAIEEFIARNDAIMVSKFFGYPSDCDYDKKIRIAFAYNLKFSCMIVLEDMDAYRDEEMGDVIFGEPFLREVTINEKRVDGMITIHNGNEEVTYQMARSHPRFKQHINEQCNKISPLLKAKIHYRGVLVYYPCEIVASNGKSGKSQLGLGQYHMGVLRERFWYGFGGCRCTVDSPGDDGVCREKGREWQLGFVKVWGLDRKDPWTLVL
nr:hypothetical protein [Tanacetum cinerariifolium]